MPRGKRKRRDWDELSTLERDVFLHYVEFGWLNRFGLSTRLGCDIGTIADTLASLLSEGFLELADNGKYQLNSDRRLEVTQHLAQVAANG